jgi:mono/diheme cytochrome c family protein
MIRALLLLIIAMMARAADFNADSTRGRVLFTSLSCVECHRVNGVGGAGGPDLGNMVDRGFTPSTLAATMWNHAPAMWAAMNTRGIPVGDLSTQAAADLFAYFYSARFFDRPGDAARGKRMFTTRGCANCHGLRESVTAGVKPVSQWESLGDSVALTEAMWNHAPRMLAEAQAKHAPWPMVRAQDLTDILVYLRNLPFPPSVPPSFRIGGGSDGEAVFRARGCAGCHRSVSELAGKTRGRTLTEVAAALWNHEPIMAMAGATPTKFAPDEMRELLGYLWTQQFFEDTGFPSQGRRVYASKKCALCHEGPESSSAKAPALKGTYTGATMVSALWRHGPSMLDQMKKDGVRWPRFEGVQMADLIAYLNSGKR